MARFTCKPNVGENLYQTFKASASITDNDIGKPVKLGAATDEVDLCADGNEIWGFIATVEPQTVDGKKLVTVMTRGRIYVELDGAGSRGGMVEAAANAAAGTANSAGATTFGYVSAHTVATDTVANAVASTFAKNWKIISGAVTDESVVLIETC